MHLSKAINVVAVISYAFLVAAGGPLAFAQLSPTFYDQTCPFVEDIIRAVIAFASIQGCDGSILLDNSETIDSEKESFANNNSARGFDVVDRMKALLEISCPGVVSCADNLTIAAQESVYLAGGPWWRNLLGRKDSRTANRTAANQFVPGPSDTLERLKSRFTDVGLNDNTDLVALSGAHTFGRAQCRTFNDRLFNFNNTGVPDTTLDPTYRNRLRQLCPQGGNDRVLANLDPTTPNVFDRNYFSNLRINRGLLQSDQELFSTPGADTTELVNKFSANWTAFFESFVTSMIRMGNLSPSPETEIEIRLNCRVVNGVQLDETILIRVLLAQFQLRSNNTIKPLNFNCEVTIQ